MQIHDFRWAWCVAPAAGDGTSRGADTTHRDDLGRRGDEFTGDVATAIDGSAYAVGTTDSFAIDQFGTAEPAHLHREVRAERIRRLAENLERIHDPWQASRGRDAASAVFVAGFTTNSGGDAVLLKFDAAGTLLWERTWGGPESDSANDVATDPDGSVYITGRETSFGGGLFVVKFDGAGNLVWQRNTNAAGGDAIAVGADGSVYTAGSIIRDDNLANFDILVVKLTSTGAEVWRRTYSAGEVVDARGRMAAAPDGSIVLAGAIQTQKRNSVDIAPLIVKLDQDGNLVFNRVFGGGETADAVAVAADDGSIYVAATAPSSGAGFQDAFVLHIESTGRKALDAVTWGGAGFEEGMGAAVAGGTVVPRGIDHHGAAGGPRCSTRRQNCRRRKASWRRLPAQAPTSRVSSATPAWEPRSRTEARPTPATSRRPSCRFRAKCYCQVVVRRDARGSAMEIS